MMVYGIQSNWKHHACGMVFLLLALIRPVPGLAEDINVLMSTEDFLAHAFDGQYQSDIVWITPSFRRQLEQAMNSSFRGARVRYWRNGNRSAWVLERIGKERPITAGFVVENNQILLSRLLTYRESRGGEIQYPGFIAQFKGASLDKANRLNRHIDGITGATLSVDAMKRMATASLLMAKESATPQQVSTQ